MRLDDVDDMAQLAAAYGFDLDDRAVSHRERDAGDEAVSHPDDLRDPVVVDRAPVRRGRPTPERRLAEEHAAVRHGDEHLGWYRRKPGRDCGVVPRVERPHARAPGAD